MKTQHTPGPWKVEDNWDNNPEERKPGRYNIRSQDGDWNVARVWEAEAAKEQVEANARLIAAAPELLEALILVQSKIGNLGAPWMHEVNVAIQKATAI